MGNRIYGCDDCLAVCPWNKFAVEASEAKLQARADRVAPSLDALARLDDAGFRAIFSGSPVKRIGIDRFLRNVLIAIGNSGDGALLPRALDHLRHRSELVRAMAVWAAGRLVGLRRAARPGAGCLGGGNRPRGSGRMGALVKLFVFGMGYSASHYLRHHATAFAATSGTVRTRDKIAELGPGRPFGAAVRRQSRRTRGSTRALSEADALLVSVQPSAGADPALQHFEEVDRGRAGPPDRLSLDDRGLRRPWRRLGGRDHPAGPGQQARASCGSTSRTSG